MSRPMQQKKLPNIVKNRPNLAGNQFFFGAILNLEQRLMIKTLTAHSAQNELIFPIV